MPLSQEKLLRCYPWDGPAHLKCHLKWTSTWEDDKALHSLSSQCSRWGTIVHLQLQVCLFCCLNMKWPHRLMCSSPWSPAGSTDLKRLLNLWRLAGGRGSLGEALRLYSPGMLPVCCCRGNIDRGFLLLLQYLSCHGRLYPLKPWVKLLLLDR